MSAGWLVVSLILLVAAILIAGRQPLLASLFRWLPIPLWCYALPAIAVALGWLPRHAEPYRLLTDRLLPLALALLLLGVDLRSLARSGGRILLAAAAGAAGIVLGAPLGAWILRHHLPPEAWRGAGALAGTWTGGTMNLLALRAILQTPDAMFAPLILVDAMIAYGWMALLVAASAFQGPINRWLGATEERGRETGRISTPFVGEGRGARSEGQRPTLALCGVLAASLALAASAAARHLPATQLVSSSSGWTVLLVTTGALILSLLAPIRRLGDAGNTLGVPCLYVVLAATGAQARLDAFGSAPAWLALGAIVVLAHGVVVVLAGRAFRIPLGTLATASQANIGGVVSAPLVGAVYHQSLAPVGLLLALAGNALGTYLGLLSATLCRLILHA